MDSLQKTTVVNPLYLDYGTVVTYHYLDYLKTKSKGIKRLNIEVLCRDHFEHVIAFTITISVFPINEVT